MSYSANPFARGGSVRAIAGNPFAVNPKDHDNAPPAPVQEHARAEGGGINLGGGPGANLSKTPDALFHGPIDTHVPGRTDRHEINVKPGSYVIPADIPSALGQGNTKAGFDVLKGMFPHHTPKHLGFAGGGQVSGLPVIAAGGEMVIEPEQIIAKFGSLKKGHAALDEMVHEVRRRHVKLLNSLPPPKK